MKISPVAQGAPMPIQTLDQGSVTPDRKAAAIAAFKGEATIQPSDTPVDPQVARMQEARRKIKMRTNVSPDREPEQMPDTDASAPPPAPAEGAPVEQPEQSSISDTGETNEQEVTKPLSPQFAALARQKRALQVKEREIREREDALKAREAGNGAPDFKEYLRANPLGALQDAGVTYEQLTEAIMANSSGVTPEIQSLKEQINSLKDELKNTLSERDQQTERQVLANLRRETDMLVSEGDAYEMVRETGSQDDVVRLIHQVWKQEGTVMDVTEAAALIEDELLKEAEKIARINKLQSRLNAAVTQQVQQPQQMPQQERQMKTLTNRDGARPLLNRRDRAIAAFYGRK